MLSSLGETERQAGIFGGAGTSCAPAPCSWRPCTSYCRFWVSRGRHWLFYLRSLSGSTSGSKPPPPPQLCCWCGGVGAGSFVAEPPATPAGEWGAGGAALARSFSSLVFVSYVLY